MAERSLEAVNILIGNDKNQDADGERDYIGVLRFALTMPQQVRDTGH